MLIIRMCVDLPTSGLKKIKSLRLQISNIFYLNLVLGPADNLFIVVSQVAKDEINLDFAEYTNSNCDSDQYEFGALRLLQEPTR